MGKCKEGWYTTNEVVTHSPLVCFGGFEQPTCEHLPKCLKDNGYYIKITKSGRKSVRRIK